MAGGAGASSAVSGPEKAAMAWCRFMIRSSDSEFVAEAQGEAIAAAGVRKIDVVGLDDHTARPEPVHAGGQGTPFGARRRGQSGTEIRIARRGVETFVAQEGRQGQVPSRKAGPGRFEVAAVEALWNQRRAAEQALGDRRRS